MGSEMCIRDRWQILLNLPIPQPTTLRQLVSIIHISCNMYVRLLSHMPPIIPTTISPHSTSHILSVSIQTPPYMADPTNPCNPQPTTLRQLASIIHISGNMHVRLLSPIPPIIPTTISPHSTSHILSVSTQTPPYVADSTESAYPPAYYPASASQHHPYFR